MDGSIPPRPWRARQALPEREDLYRFDGQWIAPEKWTVRIKIKILWIINWTVEREAYWSRYGATFKTSSGVYSVRMGAAMRITGAEHPCIILSPSLLR